MAMNEQKRSFARHLLLGKSNRDAALAAGYKAKSASSQGARLAKDPEILEYVAKLRAKAERDIGGDVGSEAESQPRKQYTDPREYLLSVMNCGDPKRADNAAAVLMPYEHSKKAQIGIRGQREDEAQELAEEDGFKGFKKQQEIFS